ncbi:transposase, IS66 family [Thioalkalivibrio nitratireducens DSM 14787]|uniref:Transposase, IS66 family n=2 Tax=Thioalkalivibrio nitratireducens (strain DSM 14787 / UNIQEM 213 / ALEN2) TaxID=1255043 RepID=L0DY09_THIND|nr:IS66 family transposase [Thioalkalivibrio nitratireducens]AGA34479.1 transposase, IS66 family [Thioalkalivibrio nitratireducens DSM 14787]
MRLSPHDLRQIDEAFIAALSEAALRVLAVNLLVDLKEAHDRLGQNPANSSRPSSSQPPWEAASAAETEDPTEDPTAPASEPPSSAATTPASDKNKAPAGKPGKRPGAPGCGRLVTLPVQEEILHSPDRCRCCGTPFPADAPTKGYNGRYALDVVAPTSGSPGLEVRHTKHVYLQRQCSCGHWTHAEPGRCAENTDWQVELTEWHLAGPMLVALICALSLRQRVSRRGVQEFLADWLGVSLSIAAIHQCLHEAGRAVAPVIERDIVPLIREAELLHVDETGWKEGNQLLWLWVFTCTTATLFAIGRRSRRMLHKILGEAFVGWLMSDGFWAYRDYDRRLRCLAHLIRKAHGLDQSLDPLARPFGAATLALFEDLLQQVYQAREGPQPPADLYQKNRGKLDAFNDLCVDHWDCAHEKTRQLAREFTHDWEAIWAVLEFPRLPITNNWAEQALRHWVISRRISQGTRTEQGSLAFALLVSVIETCRKRGVSPWPYLAQVVQQRRKGEPAPVLPEPAPAP